MTQPVTIGQEDGLGVPAAPSGSRPSGRAATRLAGFATSILNAERAVDRFIKWATRGVPIQPVVNFKGKHLFDRYEIMRWDEWPDKWVDEHKRVCTCNFCRIKGGWRPHLPPWFFPINAFLHNWNPEKGATEEFHDHPRWSITVCLKGRIVEVTPWGERELRPGSIVLRTRRAIHKFRLPPDAGDVWTLFIVGRRKVRQNTYRVTPQ
jgi:hypothetical protein